MRRLLLNMRRIGYSLQSRDIIGRYTFDPDDGQCTFCRKPGPVMHLTDKDHVILTSYSSQVSRTEIMLLSICQSCTKQLYDSFSWGNEP